MLSQKSQRQLVLINAVLILALLVVVFPLLLISQYNRPSADDWSYGVDTYRVIGIGGGVLSVLKAAIRTAYQSYFNWEGRYSNAFLAALQPGIWGEKYYSVVAYLILGSIIVFEIVLCRSVFCVKEKKDNRLYWLPVIISVLILQILYCPSPVESFYWYTGAINYTFIYGLSLVLLVLFCRLGMQNSSRWKYILESIAACILAILVGGDNFATSLSSFLTFIILSVVFIIYRRQAFYRTWFVTLLMGVSLFICIFAPGNMNRLNGNFGGETTGSAVEAVLMSLVRSATNIYSWTNTRVLLMLLFVLPFVWMAVKNIDFGFRYPTLFTLLTFGLYASQITATMYVDGTTGGMRMAAILYYSYMIWLVGNVFYWVGWLSKSTNKLQLFLDKAGRFAEKYLIVYCGIIGIVLVAVIYTFDLRDISSYKAYRDWRQGWAQQYAAEWDARIEILRDDSVKEVEFAPLTVCPEMLLYTDLQEETGYYWVNSACAQYYGKTYVHIVPPQE